MPDITIRLPASKSISNRVLIIHALSKNQEDIENVSEAQDTIDLDRCLKSNEEELYVGEGATTLRFLLSFLCLKNENKILRCAESLQKRPINTLIETLTIFNCKFLFLSRDNHLPIQIISGIKKPYPNRIQIDTSISSQFVSSILLIAPYLKHGLEIQFPKQIVSEPYLEMTITLMRFYGIEISESPGTVKVNSGNYHSQKYTVESDWSAASFFYCALALQEKGTIFFPKLKKSGLQGDEMVSLLFEKFGISSHQEKEGIRITKFNIKLPESIDFDFTNCPDLFPPVCIFCALKKINANFSGLQHLVYKESNRLKIINDFLNEQSVKINIIENERKLVAASYQMNLFDTKIKTVYPSHSDHRIAMAFSLLNSIKKVEIEHPEVVKKSFPGYWNEFSKLFA